MFRWAYFHGALLSCAATLAVAQTPPRPTDPVFVRAQTLVSDGNGVAGRALIDSVIKATSPTARLYPEALFWRASLASNAADAESDYKHIVVDFPLAPQAEDALLRLAQLELARGDRESALIHLQKIPRDYPRSRSLARASYWTARVLFEKNDIPKACAANANALAQAGESEIELRNQIQYQGQRCPPPAAAVASAPQPSGNTPSVNSAASATASSTPSTVASQPAPSPSNRVPTASPAVSEKVTVVDTVITSVSIAPGTIVPNQRPKPPAQANDTKPSIVDPTKSPANAGEKSPAKVSVSNSPSSGYSVQVAAYTSKPEADKLVSTLTKRGYGARVDGNVAPFRVRIGRYATNREAELALVKIKANYKDAFVARAPER
jgi:cell division septation protein DedD